MFECDDIVLLLVPPAIKTSFAKLQKASLAQSVYIQTLQSRHARLESYKTTIRVRFEPLYSHP